MFDWQLIYEMLLCHIEYFWLLLGLAISSVLVKYYKRKLKQLEEEGVPDDLLDMIRTMLKVLRPAYLGIIFMAACFKSTGHVYGAWMFMFGVGLVLGDEAFRGTLLYEIAKRIKETLEEELSWYEEQVSEEEGE